MRLIMYAFTSVVFMSASYCVGDSCAAKDSAESTPPSLTRVVATAYADVNQGWSSDEVLLQDELNQQFLKRCRDQMPSGTDNDFNWKLLNIRKAGRLKTNITKRRRDNHAAYKHLAEIAARTIEDKHKTQFDRILCRPQWRAEFDREAKQLAPETDPYLMRKAAMGLRKARHLRPELLLRIADWNREITTHQAADIVKDATRIPATPGVYIFRGPSGYLYIGEAINLRERLKTHLNSSDRQSLANHLKKQDIDTISVEVHAFPKDSRAKQVAVRRAYESQLIASRKPRFNVRP